MRKYVIFFILTWWLSGCISNVDSSKIPISGTYISLDEENIYKLLFVKGDYSAEIVTINQKESGGISLTQRIRFTPDETETCGTCDTDNNCALIGCEFTSQYVKYRIKNTPTEFKFNKVDSIEADGVKLVDWDSFVNLNRTSEGARIARIDIEMPH